MPVKIPIWAPSFREAAKLAAEMNLSLRHWEYAGQSEHNWALVWADVGKVMDAYRDVFFAREAAERRRTG